MTKEILSELESTQLVVTYFVGLVTTQNIIENSIFVKRTALNKL